MARYLSLAAMKLIEAAVDQLFDKAKMRYLGPEALERMGAKRIYASFKPQFSLPGIIHSAAREERAIPDQKVIQSLAANAGHYLDSYRSSAKAQVIKEVQSFLQQAEMAGVKTDLETVLGGKLADVWGKTTYDVKRMIDTELSNGRNMGALEGIIGVNTSQGIEDPVVYFVVVHDDSLCKECKRLHLLEDGVTPRCWFLSELGQGYHKKGDEHPAVGGLHPHCRCTMVTLMPGYGFGADGTVKFLETDHDELERQRGLKKAEEPLEKAIHWSQFADQLARFGWTEPVMGSKHHEITNPGANIPGPRIQNMHWQSKLESGHAQKYAHQIGLRLRPDGSLEVNPKSSGLTQHDYLSHYKKLGLYQDPAAAQVNSWTPEAPHVHVPIDQVDMPPVAHDWKVDKFQGLISGPQASSVAPIKLQKQPSGRYQVLEGAHRFGAAYLAGHTHVPAQVA
jgi:hypothetical protein